MQEQGFVFHSLDMHSNSDIFHEIGPTQTIHYMKADSPLIPTVHTISSVTKRNEVISNQE